MADLGSNVYNRGNGDSDRLCREFVYLLAVLQRVRAYIITCLPCQCSQSNIFTSRINKAACGFKDEDLNLTPEMRFQYNRENKRQYPYRSHLQWLRALYALVFCLLMILFQGWTTLVRPVSGADFVASYIAVSLHHIWVTFGATQADNIYQDPHLSRHHRWLLCKDTRFPP